MRELKEAVGVRKRELRNNAKKTWNARLKQGAVWLHPHLMRFQHVYMYIPQIDLMDLR